MAEKLINKRKTCSGHQSGGACGQDAAGVSVCVCASVCWREGTLTQKTTGSAIRAAVRSQRQPLAMLTYRSYTANRHWALGVTGVFVATETNIDLKESSYESDEGCFVCVREGLVTHFYALLKLGSTIVQRKTIFVNSVCRTSNVYFIIFTFHTVKKNVFNFKN